MQKSQRVVVIGAGFAGLSSAACLAQRGYSVTLIDRHAQPGGRARTWESEGFIFDLGPSWYWMPDVFENWFAQFGKKVSDYYELRRLDPGYRVYYGEEERVDVPALRAEQVAMFERTEPGAGQALENFLDQAAYKYRVGMSDYVFRPSHSIWEFFDLRLMRESVRIQMFQSLSKHVRKHFSHPNLVKLLEFPVLFLGATPQNTPALYSLMNWADLGLGTWYPMGGMHQIAAGMAAVAREMGVEFRLGEDVKRIEVDGKRARQIVTQGSTYEADIVVATADYHHVEQKLLPPKARQYSPSYWEKRAMSPSSLLFYLGVNKRLKGLEHHNLFFDEDFEQHAQEIYDDPRWPTKPLFYVCAPSKTDPAVAPQGCENLFLLVPLAPGLEDSDTQREKCYDTIMNRLERLTGQSIRDSVVTKRSFAMRDFESTYNSFKGNAYGLANTLRQTAFFKPKMRSRKLENLYYAGQLTVPGPGVPPSIISGQVAASEIEKQFGGRDFASSLPTP